MGSCGEGVEAAVSLTSDCDENQSTMERGQVALGAADLTQQREQGLG